MATKASKLTPEQKEDFEKVFKKFDKDDSGAIERGELQNMINSFGFEHLSEEDMSAIMATIDSDLSETVSKEEFLEFMASKEDMLNKELSMSIFQMIDHNNDGEINLDEFTHIMKVLRPQLKEAELKKIFAHADSESLTREKFHEALKAKDCSIWKECSLTLQLVAVIRETVEQYSRLAKAPADGFGKINPLPFGKDNAKKLGYNVDDLPDEVWASACQCANVFDIVEKKDDFKDATVVEFGCGAGADLCVAGKLVGSKGKVIGIDMNRQMVKKATENIAKCELSEVASAHLGIFDMPELPAAVKPNSADFIVVNGTINLSVRKPCAFQNAYTALKKGGVLLLADVVMKDPSVTSQEGKGSWCDCVAGAVSVDKILDMLKKAKFTDVKHLGFGEYKTSDNTPTATFIAMKGKKQKSSMCTVL